MQQKSFYAERSCENPLCREKFYPSRPDKLFCSVRCKNKSNNDKRKVVNDKNYCLEKLIRNNERVLSRLFSSSLYPRHEVAEVILRHERFQFQYYTDQNLNTRTQNLILWSHSYGIELKKEATGMYLIHKRDKLVSYA